MPYTTKNAPDWVQKLPKTAREGWVKAFNAALAQYDDDETRAFKVANSALGKMGYVKHGDKWVKSESALLAALRKQTQFRSGELVISGVEGESVTLTHSGKPWLVGFTADEHGGYAFGTPAERPVVEDERKPFEHDISEHVEWVVLEDDAEHKAAPGAGLWPIVIIESGVNHDKRRQYTAASVDGAPDYAKVPVHIDHAGNERQQQPRSVRDMSGVITESWGYADNERSQKRGMLQLFDPWAIEMAQNPAWRKLVGFSHVARVGGYIGKIAGKSYEVIETIFEPHAVDIVSRAAFGGAFSEDGSGISKRLEELVALESLTGADLARDRQDLVDEIKTKAVAEFKAQESDSDELTKLKVENTRLNEQNRKTAIETAVGVAVNADKSGVPEAAREQVTQRAVDRLVGGDTSADQLAVKATEAVKAEVEFGKGFTGTATPAVNAGESGAEPELQTDDKTKGMQNVLRAIRSSQ